MLLKRPTINSDLTLETITKSRPLKSTTNQIGHLKKHRMREPGSDGNLNVMFFKDDNMLNDPPDCQEHRSSFYMEFIKKHDEQVSTYT